MIWFVLFLVLDALAAALWIAHRNLKDKPSGSTFQIEIFNIIIIVEKK